MDYIMERETEPSCDYSPRLIELTSYNVSDAVIEYLVNRVIAVGDAGLKRDKHAPAGRVFVRTEREKFERMVERVIKGLKIRMPVVLIILAYLDRADNDRFGLRWKHRKYADDFLFLGVVLAAHKYSNEHTYSSEHWGRIFCRKYNKSSLAELELKFLKSIKWNLFVREEDVLVHYKPLMSLLRPIHGFDDALPFPEHDQEDWI
ncbi:hypothetical protein OF83DRAFT_670880 [Amylostereum chailletii]|nr:hypothetical protein OF83DRAFT_670880 [Amylostereum chailletii]